MNVSEIVQTLGLKGDGVGGLVGLRSAKALYGTGVAFTTTEVRIVELNPPEAVVVVSGVDAKSLSPTKKTHGGDRRSTRHRPGHQSKGRKKQIR